MNDKNTIKEIIKVSKVLKEKFNALKHNKMDNKAVLQETFEPITNPLKELVKYSTNKNILKK